MSGGAYKLSQTLLGHSQDVKAVTALSDDVVVSASRDATARQWSVGQRDCTAVYNSQQVQQHKAFVNAVSQVNIGGIDYILTAGADCIISAWLPGSKEPDYMLMGHTSNVCCLATSPSSLIVSGSWDKTVKLWKDWNCVATLGGHAQAVWAVALLPNDGGVLTACADNLIRLFTDLSNDNETPATVFHGHTQPVRALVVLSDGQNFASAANDGSIRLWNLDSAQEIRRFEGHDSFVYSLAFVEPDQIASSGEDRTVRLWQAQTGALLQIITLPATSIWAVAALPNGDLVTGASDGAVRIFTRSADRLADAATLKEYEDKIAGSAINANQVGDIKKTDLPGPEVLLRPGNKEGQVMMVKQSDGSVEAHQWSNASREWVKIGTVVDAVGSGRKQLYNGQEYDFVFDVDIKDGAPPLKLPYNASQNPFDAATKFLNANNLPLNYVDEVVKFIEKNTGGVSIGTAAGADPFTGGSSYRPGQTQQPQQPAPTASSSAPASSIFPHRQISIFTQANLPAMRTKIGTLNEQMQAESNGTALDQSGLQQLDTLINTLTSAQKTPPGPAGAKLPAEALDIVLSLLEWSPAARFPAIDLYRVALLYTPPTSSSLRSLLSNLGKSGKEGETNSMLSLRAIANAFNTRKGEFVMKEHAAQIFAPLRSARPTLSKLGKVALATILMNFSVLAIKQDLDKSVGGALVDALVDALQEEEPEALYRALYATGNLLLSPNVIGALSTTTVEKMRSQAVARAARSPDSRLHSLGQEVKSVRTKQTY